MRSRRIVSVHIIYKTLKFSAKSLHFKHVLIRMILTHCNLPFILNYKLNLLYYGSVSEHDVLWASISFDGLPWKLERKEEKENTFVKLYHRELHPLPHFRERNQWLNDKNVFLEIGCSTTFLARWKVLMVYAGFALKASVFIVKPWMTLIMGVQAVWNSYQPTSPAQTGRESERWTYEIVLHDETSESCHSE